MKYNCIVTNPKIIKRWNNLMYTLCFEYEELPTSSDDDLRFSEVASMRKYYGVEDGVTYGYLKSNLKYWLSCYYECGHCRYEDKFEDKESYDTWVSETGKLKRFIKALEKYDDDEIVIIWEYNGKEV